MKNGPIKRMTLEEVQQALGYKIEIVDKKTCEIQKIRPGVVISFNGIDFVILEHCERYTIAITKEAIFSAPFDVHSNHYGHSDGFRSELEYWTRQNIGGVSGRDIFDRYVDLTADNGCDTYGHLTSYFAPLTLDEFRKYYRVLSKFQLKEKWWLVTPHGTKGKDSVMVCAVDGDDIDFVSSRLGAGVRPVICFHPKTIVQAQM